MNTHEIGADVFEKYARDLLQRLSQLRDDERPTVWAPIGRSGRRVSEELSKVAQKAAPDWFGSLRVVIVDWDPSRGAWLLHGDDDCAILANARVLLIDSVVNSGATMRAVHDLIRAKAPGAEITAFALAFRHVAAFVPNLFALLVGPSDRVFLPWHDSRSNNRLVMSGSFGLLSAADLTSPPLDTRQEFINRPLWKDRWFEMRAEPGRRVLVCRRKGGIAAFINFKVDAPSATLHVDEVGTSKAHEKKGLGGALMRFAETYARAEGCSRMTLWAHVDVANWYESNHYFAKAGPAIHCADDGSFQFMERQLGSSKDELEAWHRSHASGFGAPRSPGGVEPPGIPE